MICQYAMVPHPFSRPVLLAGIALFIGAAVATGANAQQAPAAETGIEEITVTARKRTEKLQEVPIAVSAISGAQLARRDVQSVMDLSSIVPNFQAPRNTVSFSAPQFFLRGAGRANNNWNAENAIAVFVDDIYLQSTAAAYIDQIDFERVEVLRGPQGTLYGRNATVGAIKFIPRKPDLEELRVSADITLGSNSRNDLKGYVSVPLVQDKVAVKLNGYYTQNDGFTTRVDSSSNRDIDRSIASTEHYGARLSSLFRVIDGTEFELNFDAFQQNDGTNLMTPIVPDDPTSLAQLLSKNGSSNFQPLFGARRGALEPLTARGGFQGRSGSNYDGFGIVFKASIESGIGTFKSITGYRTYDGHYLTQLSSTDSRSTIFGVTIGSTVETDEDYKQFSQEFQLTGTIQDKFNYTAGLYYFNNQWSQLQYGSTIGVPVEFSPVSHPGFTERFGGSFQDTHLDSKSYAIYLDAAWEFVENVSLIGGVRQTWDKKRVDYDSLFEDNITRYPGFPVNPSRDYSRFTPRVGLNWQATPDVLLFGTYAEGYKAGNLEGDRATSPGPASNFLDPETVKTFEVGIKAEWFDRTLRTNIAAFSSKFTNHADLISPETVALSDQKVNGLEFEVTWVPIRSLQIYANLGLLDSKYTRADASHPIFAPDFSGFAPGLDAEPVVTPDYNFSMGIYYEHDLASAGKLAFNGSFEGVGSQFNGLGVANLDSERVKAYTVAAASVTYRTANNRFSVTAGVNNLFDATYWTTGFFGSVPEFAGRAYADGRTGYVRMGFSF